YSKIGAIRNRNPARSYWELAKHLHSREFVWLIPNDDNRMEDGLELRDEFLAELSVSEVDPQWYGLGCSVLEMLVALCKRASFETDQTVSGWFWLILGNCGLRPYNDALYSADTAPEVDEILDRIIYRTYSPNGEGGLFPLRKTNNDQRKVELWYQLAEYILEDFPP